MDKIRSKYIKQTLAELQGKINNNPRFNIPISTTEQTEAHHVSYRRSEPQDKLDVMDIEHGT